MSVINNRFFIIRSNVEIHGMEYAIKHESKRLMRVGMGSVASKAQARLTVAYALKR